MLLTIELTPSDPNYARWRDLIALGDLDPKTRVNSYLDIARAHGRKHGFTVQDCYFKYGYPASITLEFEQDRDYTWFVMRCL